MKIQGGQTAHRQPDIHPGGGFSRAVGASPHLVAGLLRDAPAGGRGAPRLLWRDPDGSVHARRVSGAITMGCDPGCDVILPYPGVAPRHCLLGPAGASFEIVDLGTANGTCVNGRQVGEHLRPLEDGDVIEIGGEMLVFFA